MFKTVMFIYLNTAVYVLTCINVPLEDAIWQLLY